MLVTIFRHGEAGEAVTDRSRALTTAGARDVGHASSLLQAACTARKIAQPSHIEHSPWRRTLQTAGILAAGFTHGRITPQKALRPGGSVAEVDAVVAQLEVNQQHCLLVSHQPLVSYLLDHYLGKQHNVPTLPPGGLATLSLDPLAQECGAALFWMFPPDYAVGR
jgi:phosphohistidine phosphatase